MKMESRLVRQCALALMVGSLVWSGMRPAFGELQIVEIMYNPSNDDGIYEWIEVRNTGATDIDLDGAWMDDFDPFTAAIPPTGNPTVGANASNSIVPAGGVAIIYDAFTTNGSPANFNDQLFRDSWGLGAGVHLIAGDFFPNLNNTSPGSAPNNYVDNIGIWADPDPSSAANPNYELDVDRQMDMNNATDRVISFANTIANQYYRTSGEGWPTAQNGVSIQWNGVGDRSNGANWYSSVSGQNGATTNQQIQVDTPLNNTGDVANPGVVPGGTAPTGLIFTEILYDPSSPEVGGNNWEWVEVYNNTGAPIDFSSTPYWYSSVSNDLPSPGGVTSPNITSGSIPNGTAAMLFNADGITVEQMKAAWGDLNFIPVANAPALSNTAPNNTALGLWDSETDYETDTTGINPNVFTNAVATVDYNEEGAWPATNGGAGESIYLSSLDADPTLGASWIAALASDGISYSPDQVNGSLVIHPGGDVGSPGSFVVVDPGQEGDYNEDGLVDAADYVLWRKDPNAFGGDPAGYDAWKANFGEGGAGAGGGAVPEPTSLLLIAVGLAALAFRRSAA